MAGYGWLAGDPNSRLRGTILALGAAIVANVISLISLGFPLAHAASRHLREMKNLFYQILRQCLNWVISGRRVPLKACRL
jgi:hypothetical protein